jgi:hypothetical protein
LKYDVDSRAHVAAIISGKHEEAIMQAHRTVQRIRAPLFLALSAFAVGGLATAVAHAQGLTLPQMAEPPVSPINPGTLPGSAIGGNATGVNPITGLPCGGAGSTAESGIGGLIPGQTPIGTPPTTSIYGFQSSLGPC